MSTSSGTEFTGNRALVTGGTRGMGEAIVHRLRSAGATVIATARSTPLTCRSRSCSWPPTSARRRHHPHLLDPAAPAAV
jgi:NAD(P)-dependent dehydrogenase (short-subunit alcohol dehydrogenase family)